MSKFLDDERKANLERLPLLESALKDVQAARNFPFAPRMKRVRRLVELMSYAKTFAGLGDVEAALPKPQFPVQTGDDCKDAAAVSEVAQKKYEKAIKAYTEDGRGGVFWKINGPYRKVGAAGNDKTKIAEAMRAVANMDSEARETDAELMELFGFHAMLKEPARVYRGIGPQEADNIEKRPTYIEYAYSSTSTSFSVAFDYAMKKGSNHSDPALNGAVLVIDMPSGFPAISLEDRSVKPYEKEVLLNRKRMFVVNGVTIAKTAKGMYRIIHLEGRKS